MTAEPEPITRKPILKKQPSGKFKMQDFQRTDLAALMELQASANWSEMGAMKTTTAEWLAEIKTKHIPNPRILVITTKSGKGTYLESLWEVLPEWEVFTIDRRKRRIVVGGKVAPFNVNLPDADFQRPMICIAHYHCFTNSACIPEPYKADGKYIFNENGTIKIKEAPCQDILLRDWDMVIVDEAHRIKNPDAEWTRNIKKIKATYRHVMTGTGFINNPAEVWSLLNFLYPKIYRGYNKFADRYCEFEDYNGYRKVVGINPDHEEEFRELIRRVGVRRTMLECFPNIKEPIRTTIPVDLNPVQRKMYEEIRDDLMTMDAMGEPLHSPNVLSMLNRLRQICVATPKIIGEYYDAKLERRVIKVELVEPSSKLDALMELIDELPWDMENKEQLVVFSSFRDPLNLLKKRLDNHTTATGRPDPIPYLHLHAGMNDDDRYKMWHDVWPTKQHRIFLCTLAVGSESINLTSAHRAVFLDQSWSPKDNNQAIGRVYRPGQTEAAQIIHIRADGTVDDRILKVNELKSGWFQQIFGAGNGPNTEIGNDDEIEI